VVRIAFSPQSMTATIAPITPMTIPRLLITIDQTPSCFSRLQQHVANLDYPSDNGSHLLLLARLGNYLFEGVYVVCYQLGLNPLL
jgi:hypothetical protein